ncbi:hypothetical protein [Streptomyces sp. NPDC089919]|uniref:hypothetical protein n=1 Tax=Streptomyces sp. NPDC089919 TaxID=3155188 RepID=UPI00343FF737
MARELNTDELVVAMKAVDEAGRLLDEALAAHGSQGVKRSGEDYQVAGGTVQTLQGAEEMARGARRFLAELARALGYATAGLPHRGGDLALTVPGIAGGGARMARPLLDPTVEALHLLLTIDALEPACRAEIEGVLLAEKATYPDPAAFRVPSGAAAQ